MAPASLIVDTIHSSQSLDSRNILGPKSSSFSLQTPGTDIRQRCRYKGKALTVSNRARTTARKSFGETQAGLGQAAVQWVKDVAL